MLAQGEAPAGEQDLSLPDILIRLATAFRRSPPVIAGEDVPFGQVRVEGTVACTLCGVCAQICPTQALGLTHTSTEEALTFKHAACVACGSCVEHCPEHVLRLERALDINQLSGPVQVRHRIGQHACKGAAGAPLFAWRGSVGGAGTVCNLPARPEHEHQRTCVADRQWPRGDEA
ncbi:MAG: 4Fe-4S binding protein [Nitrospinae bacterium]|nr:4Fe-4S binding protein [Nitrospinota bacterium]